MSTTTFPPVRIVPLGRTVATPGAIVAILNAGASATDLLDRHVNGDWGDVDAEDARANDHALKHGERLLSAYTLPDGQTKIWVITEWDRSVTTLLLPSEY